ncbi:MAG: hypothetical protein ABI895_33995 [Deltaproteobacteria bacterium]
MQQLNDAGTAPTELSDYELALVIGGSSRFVMGVDNPGQRTLQYKLRAAIQRLFWPITG